MIVFIILWFSFVQLMYLIYNEKTKTFSTIVKSMETNFLIILGKFSLSSLLNSNYSLSAFVFSVYNILIVLIMINILITIICNNISKTKKEIRTNKQDEYLFRYLKERLKSKIFKRNDTDLKYTDIINSFEIKTNQMVNYLENQINTN